MIGPRKIRSKLLAAIIGCAALSAAAAPGASADLEFSETAVSLKDTNGLYSRQAGAHADFSFKFAVPPGPPESVRDVDLDLPVGLVGNPTPFPTCGLSTMVVNACPIETEVGKAEIKLNQKGWVVQVAIYNMPHGSDVPAQFGFKYSSSVATIVPRVRPGDYGISSGSFQITQAEGIEWVRVKFWGVPADPAHNSERQNTGNIEIVDENLKSTLPRVPFFTNPTSCPDQASIFKVRGDSWQDPGVWDEELITTDEEGTPFVWEGCENLPFEPTLNPVPGTHRAHSPTGLDVNLDLPSNEGPDGFSSSAVKEAVLTFPEGMTVSASAVAGLEACTEAQVGLGNSNPPACPSGSKIGNITIDTQLLPEPLPGEVVLASQNENPFGSIFAVYMLVRGPGFYLKLPGELNVDKQNGRLKTVFSNLPQLPFENVHIDFRGGPTAPLVTPNKCGDYSIRTEVFPWARPNDPVVAEVPMPINEACEGGGEFKPRLQAGVENPVAGARSPLTIRVTRQDGEQNISKIEVTLPKGEIANLKGLAVCPDDLAPSGSCPQGSQVGIATTAIGTGAFPLFVPQPGKEPTALYLAGPYKGAPYSLVTKAPAQAGPFDFGDIVVRTAIDLNPVTAQVIAKSDPLPQILEGVPIAYRDVRIEVKKPDFSVNPTSCEQRYVTTTITSVDGTEAHPSVPTKVGDCGALAFGPKLKFRLKGGTHRGDYPALTATMTTGKKEANLARISVTLPHSEFLEQGHIGTVCTRVQFAADNCPAASVYGFARAITPLLDKPLEGPVYMRSSSHPLPDLVADLKGQFDIELAGRIDAKNGGIRNTFETVPDAPVTKFVLKMKGGKKSLLVNSRNLCKGKPARATVNMVGQNGKRHNERPIVQNSCGKKSKKGHGGKRKR
ncbi:MAG TPA: hypothetical protein VGW80_06455 [Solirubrobacterales bacterium]|jgi:hypothetical protein|nr:hypothetical protein [Solirubrobacterales bacterium]